MRKNRRHILADLLVNIPILLLSLSSIFPVIWLLYASLKSDEAFAINPFSLPRELHFENYVKAFSVARFGTFVKNSLVTSLVSLALVLIISFTMGYLLSRYRFFGRGFIYGTLMAVMMIPVYALTVPLFMEEKQVGILNSAFSLFPVYTAVEVPMAVFLFDSYLRSISVEMEEAASIDGASMLEIMYGIMLPICKPVLVTVGMLTFMHVWNEFPFARVLIIDEELKTIPIGLTYFTSQYTTNYTLLLAALAMATLPVLLLYLFCHRMIADGMMAGAVKG